MSIRINGEVLRHQAAIRGWNGSALAKAAGVCNSTVSTAFASNRVTVTTLVLFAKALEGGSVDEGLERLLDRGDPPPEGDQPPTPGTT